MFQQTYIDFMTPSQGAKVRRNNDFLDQFYFNLGQLNSPLRCFAIASLIAAVTAIVPLIGTFIILFDSLNQHKLQILVLAYLFPFFLVLACSFVLMRGFHILHQRNVDLRQAVDQDELTGLGNRSVFYRQGKSHMLDARLANNALSLIMLDADYFKSINDTFGHLAGDHALQHLAQIFLHCTRDSDVVARWGGEEFVILLPNADQHGVMRFAERLRERVCSSPFIWNGEQVYLTLSAGVTQLTGEDTSLENLVTRADKALYLAKSAGRNQVHAIWADKSAPCDEQNMQGQPEALLS